MLTMHEAKQRLVLSNASIKNTGWGDYRVVLNEWRGDDAERKAYYSDDLEDCVLTAQRLRREQQSRVAQFTH